MFLLYLSNKLDNNRWKHNIWSCQIQMSSAACLNILWDIAADDHRPKEGDPYGDTCRAWCEMYHYIVKCNMYIVTKERVEKPAAWIHLGELSDVLQDLVMPHLFPPFLRTAIRIAWIQLAPTALFKQICFLFIRLILSAAGFNLKPGDQIEWHPLGSRNDDVGNDDKDGNSGQVFKTALD